MLVKSARRYINTLNKILKNQHNDIITEIAEDDDMDIFSVTLKFHVDGLYCFVAAFNNDDNVLYYVEGNGRAVTYIISDNETQKESMYTILNRIYDIVVRLTSENEETEETEKHYYDYTSEDFIKAGIAKECTDCPDFCEEDCIENAECSRGYDVFDGCKTVKEVMEVKQELNARFGKEQYFDTDSLQPNKAISAKIENINHCPNQNTCCIVSPFVHCNYNYKSDSCIKAHKNFIYQCKQVHKQMKAINNPEWHHVNIETCHNIDFDTIDEKRKVYLSFYKKWQEVRKNLKKCSCGHSYERCYNSFRRLLIMALDKKKISKELVEYFDRQISMVNVECGVWSSAVEVATGQHESRKYNRPTLRY